MEYSIIRVKIKMGLRMMGRYQLIMDFNQERTSEIIEKF